MPRLSLYRSEKSNDYKFFDKTIAEMLTVGGTDLFVHKYLGPKDQGPTQSKSQPQYDSLDPNNIQDLLFLENRDRKYEPNIYRLRGHYNTQNLDFDLSQFGLFLTNDVIFITTHYNTMIDTLGRKLMVGDVLELPHLTDYHPLNDKIPTSLRRYYQVTDANYASEGFSSTWYYHLWRIKCEPLIDSQEFSNILEKPMNTDNYLGEWNRTSTYVSGYVVTYGNKNYTPLTEVAAGIPCEGEAYSTLKIYPPNTLVSHNGITYLTKQEVPLDISINDTDYFEPIWQLDTADNLKDILSRYNRNIEINKSMDQEAARIVPANGYDRKQLYLVPTNLENQPASPRNVITRRGMPERTVFTLDYVDGNVPIIRLATSSLKDLNDLAGEEIVKSFMKLTMEVIKLAPTVQEGGSKSMEPELALSIKAVGPINVPYGTVDNINSDAAIDVDNPTFNTDVFQITEVQDFRADADPRYRFVGKESPRSFGYTSGYLSGEAAAPNGEPFGTGIEFPSNPKIGAYFLRIDYLPQQMFRYDGNLWVKISEVTRTEPLSSSTQLGSFINNSNVTPTLSGSIPESQPLSTILGLSAD
jgi:hypothetical protein